MSTEDAFIFPRLQFGNVLLAPQPPRGWEVNEEVLHANLSVPPTHQYLAFYHWLHTEFEPHALIHLGRHSTYEFLPGKRVGLSNTDYPRLIAGQAPGLYPYIVEGVAIGEAFGGLARLQKRHVQAVEALARARISRADLAARIGPSLGLIGTLIPLGPGIAAMGRGDFQTFSDAIATAFDIEVVGNTLCKLLL